MLQYATRAPTPGLPQFCSCHRILDLEHAVHCDTAKLQRHNMLQHRLVAFAREQHVATKQNERFSLEHARTRQEPDIVFYFGAETWETDVTVVNPCAPTRLLLTLNKPGAALAARCREKNRKYLPGATSRSHSSFRWALRLMDALVNHSSTYSPSLPATLPITWDTLSLTWPWTSLSLL